ncbi:hypothetical protein Raf01_18620 [Rugosimonospora africana]|uniref:Uncharacterized protein n=1 Tax=Rugosimonospora africana TaxID=556532 RepID=A0A8J3VP36_9ACTN|nr:hypothetical protein Raf01_18620 [Rugosimonospora africana]
MAPSSQSIDTAVIRYEPTASIPADPATNGTHPGTAVRGGDGDSCGSSSGGPGGVSSTILLVDTELHFTGP